MHFHDKLKVMRTLKGWSQEEMAEKLGCSVSGYSKIERGEIKTNMPKLEKIAEAFGIEFEELVNLNEGNVFNLAEHCNNNGNIRYNVILTETQCAHELEKAHLIIEQKDKEIALMKQQIEDLRTMLNLVKTT